MSNRRSLWLAAGAALLLGASCASPPECGNGIVEEGEECDDGNQVDDDGCTNACMLPRCGDGITQGTEECDDGNEVDEDDCTNACRLPRCGDGILHVGVEACDDGNRNDHDACTNACTLARCGDGVVHIGHEACDDGNDIDDDDCTNDCQLPRCGDGIVQAGEQCDDGNLDDQDACTNACTVARCGDGIVQLGVEACDDGNQNNHDACTNACELAFCGDGIVHVGVEACDDGADTPDCVGCRIPTCGDGIVQPPEECDDGNTDNTDTCLANCTLPFCGDGIVQSPREECDDGNQINDDGCTNDCQLPRCGDGILQAGEQCDDGNDRDDDACLSSCVLATCGDGYVWAGREACDDGNRINDDACLNDCTVARCGDGVVWAGVEACDDGNDDNTDACLVGCVPARCGDGHIWAGHEECDDANRDNTDGCLQTCRSFDFCAGFGIEAVDPPSACEGAALPESLWLQSTGRGFLFIDGVEPVVFIAGEQVAILDVEDCLPVPGAFVQADGCGRMEVNVPPSLEVGDHLIEVEQPITAICEDFGVFTVGPVPELQSVEPAEICADIDVTVEVFGTGLLGATALRLRDASGAIFAPTSTALIDGGAQLTFDEGVPAGVYDVLASNGPDCGDELLGVITVYPRPIIFFVDPPVVYNAVPVDATLYVANVNAGAVDDVRVRRVGTSSFTSIDYDFDPDTPTRLTATIPAELVDDGERATYEVALTDGLGCPTRVSGQADLTRDMGLGAVAARPPFASSDDGAAVLVEVDTSEGGVPFAELPRVYLVPDGGGTAVPLAGVTWLTNREVVARVPAGLDVGVYDLIVVNPDGFVGVDEGGFRITDVAPPEIEYIAPGSVAGAGVRVQMVGENFANLEVSLWCTDGSAGAEPVRFDASGVQSEPNGASFLVPAGITQNSACLVRATNTAASAFDEYAALVVLNSALNVPAPFDSGEELLTPRRAPVVVSGRNNRVSSFVYAFGGESGAQILDTAEVAPLSRFGVLGAWRQLPIDLPMPLTEAVGVSTGDYLYLGGGLSSTGARAEMYRAQVLRFEDAPSLTDDLVIALDEDGLGVGTWHYAVSAVRSMDHAPNPGGESLPSEVRTIVVPAWSPEGFEVTLHWTEVPDVSGYRIYRTAQANDSVVMLGLVAEVDADTLSWVDPAAAPSAQRPRRPGDLGVWVDEPSMTTPRHALGFTAVRDPVLSTTRHVYALGGRTTGGSPVDSWERLTLSGVGGGAPPTAAAWTPGLGSLPSTKADFLAYAVDAEATTTVEGSEAWLYLGPGAGGGVNARRIYAAEVLAGGDLATQTAVTSPWLLSFNGSFNRAGYGGVASSGQLFLFGGNADGEAIDARSSGNLLPDGALSNINAVGNVLVEERAWQGSTRGSGFIFQVGGEGSLGEALRSVEQGLW